MYYPPDSLLPSASKLKSFFKLSPLKNCEKSLISGEENLDPSPTKRVCFSPIEQVRIKTVEESNVNTIHVVKCAICNESFDNFSIIFHVKKHFILDDISNGKAHKRKFCLHCLRTHNQESILCATSLNKYCFIELDKDVTYSCPVCQLKDLSYHVLFAHFKYSHSLENQTFCPFCLETFNLPIHDSGSSFLLATTIEYCSHVGSHYLKPRNPCKYCRLTFSDPEVFRFHKYNKHHNMYRNSFNNTLVMKSRIFSGSNFELHVDEMKSFLIHANKGMIFKFAKNRIEGQCIECRLQYNSNILDHYLLHYTCKSCRFETNCTIMAQAHTILAHPCAYDEINKNFRSYHTKSQSVALELSDTSMTLTDLPMTCTCGFKTVRIDLMTLHLHEKACGSTASAKVDTISNFYQTSIKSQEIPQSSTPESKFLALVGLRRLPSNCL